MYSVEGALQSRHLVGSECDTFQRDRRRERKGEGVDKPNTCRRKPALKPELRRMGPTKRKQMRGSREAECILWKARSEAAIQSEGKATQRKSKQKRTIKEKKRRELYDGGIVDPTMLYAGVSGGGEDEDRCQGDAGGPFSGRKTQDWSGELALNTRSE
jgi:hypothetical protein